MCSFITSEIKGMSVYIIWYFNASFSIHNLYERMPILAPVTENYVKVLLCRPGFVETFLFTFLFGRRQAPPALQRSSKTGRNTKTKAQSYNTKISVTTPTSLPPIQRSCVSDFLVFFPALLKENHIRYDKCKDIPGKGNISGYL